MKLFGRKTDETQKSAGQANTARRLSTVNVVLICCFCVALGRLVQIQIVESKKYQEIARRQYEAKVYLPSTRGTISDRNGNILASNALFVSFSADPKIASKSAGKIAQIFARTFGKSESYYREKLTGARRFVWLERRVKPDLAKTIDVKRLEGVVQINEPKRLYHYEEIGGQLVGATNFDNTGISGTEYSYDKQLRGIDGWVIMQLDGLGRPRPSIDYPRQDPVDGHSIALTIDIGYQSIVLEELKKGAIRANADAGVAIVLKPGTGEILAMAQFPAFTPGAVSGVDMQTLKNRAVTDVVEPGSVFKVVIAAAALENKLVRPDQMFFGENGKYRVPLNNGKFRVINDTHESGMITFEKAMEVSSNIVMAKVSDIVGAERLYTQARTLGFGMQTGIELPGEANGNLNRPVEWSMTSLNSIAFGYEVGVTPLQVACAYAAIANGGKLMKPYIIAKEFSETGVQIYTAVPQVIRQVVSEATVATLKEFFLGVVERGTGMVARVPGVSIAGKTGTSRRTIEGEYKEGLYNASFVGFFPADRPEVLCLVMLENPKAIGYTGGMVSAPIFKAITQRLVNNYGVLSQTRTASRTPQQDAPAIVVPDVKNLKKDVAQEMLREKGITANILGAGDVVVRQSPDAGAAVRPGGVVQLFTQSDPAAVFGSALQVPDLRGMSVRRAITRLAAEQLDASVKGSGVVTSQYPEAGAPVKKNSRIILMCEHLH